MKIAILGWGSLTWNPKGLLLADGAWHPDGPLLPVEFARISGLRGPPPQRLTLVLRAEAPKVRALWAESAFDDFERARDNLGEREDVPKNDRARRIGYVKVNGERQLTSIADRGLTDMLQRWSAHKSFDAVIWTDLESNFEQSVPGGPIALTPASAVDYLRSLQGADAAAAEEYVRRAPAQIRTPIREKIEEELEWLPSSIDPALSTGTIKTNDDLRMKEWAECRAMIGRFDTILADLRKLGFSLITGLLTASAFFGLMGVGEKSPPAMARAAAFIAIMWLIAALFSVDAYYQVLLSAAVERALDLEIRTDPPIRVSKYLSINASRSKAVFVTVGLYLVLLAIVAGLGLLATGEGLTAWATGPAALLGTAWAADHIHARIIWISGIGLLAAAFAVVRLGWRRFGWGSRPDGVLFPIGTGLALWVTLGFGAFAYLGATAEPTGSARWIVAVGAILAAYVEIYWAYVTWRSGLHSEKHRNWPEGEGKTG